MLFFELFRRRRICYLTTMRVVSFVPSWTETLIASGVDVVGRTRFCIHPEPTIKRIPVVGGTKNINSIDEIVQLKPDLVLFDKEENNQEMYRMCLDRGLTCYASHVTNLKTCGEELIKLAEILNNSKLSEWGKAYLNLKKISLNQFQKCVLDGQIPDNQSVNNMSYVIWKKPFMRVSPDTFIGDVLSLFGITLVPSETKYPEISEEELKKTFCIFSSEPFPFAKFFAELQTQGFKGVLVDGERLSWYGTRTLTFLQSLEPS